MSGGTAVPPPLFVLGRNVLAQLLEFAQVLLARKVGQRMDGRRSYPGSYSEQLEALALELCYPDLVSN